MAEKSTGNHQLLQNALSLPHKHPVKEDYHVSKVARARLVGLIADESFVK
jgi:hypothetical protein